MDGLHQMVSTETEIVIDGTAYRLMPLKAKHYAQIERRLLELRPDPLEAVRQRLDGLPEHLQRHLVGLAYDRLLRGARVAADELWEWMNGHEGTCYVLWLSLRENHPDLTLEDCRGLVDSANQDQLESIQQKLDQANGLTVGNPAGQAQSTATETAGDNPSRGAASFAN